MKVEVNGKIFRSLRAVAAAHNIDYSSYMGRIYRGWDPARAATEPVQPDRFITYDGMTHTVAEWARIKGIEPNIIYHRLDRGFNAEQALDPVRERRKFDSDAQRRAARQTRRDRIAADIREKLRRYKARPCMDCKQTFHSDAMEFDHVRGKKLFNLSRPPLNLKRVAAEIAKCDLVCANCHRLRTASRRPEPA